MTETPAKTIEEAREMLASAANAAQMAAHMLRPHLALFAQFRQEAQLMDSVGPILNPTLFKSSERAATQAFLAPIFDEAERFVRTVDRQTKSAREALEKVKETP
jgi:hypothetical protein